MPFIQKATRITFPRSYTSLHVSDTGNGLMSAALRLPLKDVQPFVEEYRFQPVPKNDITYTNRVIHWVVDDVRAHFAKMQSYPPVPDDSSVMWLQGMYENRWPWQCIVEPSTGWTWIVVGYPDAGGD